MVGQAAAVEGDEEHKHTVDGEKGGGGVRKKEGLRAVWAFFEKNN